MIRIYSAIMLVSLCISCTHANKSDSLSCPTPAQDSPINLWPNSLTDRQLLENTPYISLMINHGTDRALENILIKSQSMDTLGAVTPSYIRRVKDALAYRELHKCDPVPDYMPYYSSMPVYPAM